MKATIYLVDDHNLVRGTLKLFLESFEGFSVVGQAGDAETALREIGALRPDVVIMDITLQDADGTTLTRELLARLPEAKVIAVTMHPERDALLPFLQAGGKGYVQKSCAGEELLRAVETVQAGRLYLSDEGVQLVARQVQSPGREPERGAAGRETEALSERERQVLGMLASGYTCREIGEKLYLATSTVDTYKRRIKEKLDLHSRTELVEFALRHKIFSAQ